jgi:hypothetical protein
LQTSDGRAKAWAEKKFQQLLNPFVGHFYANRSKSRCNQFSINHFLPGLCICWHQLRAKDSPETKAHKKYVNRHDFFLLILLRLSATTIKMVIETKENDYET